MQLVRNFWEWLRPAAVPVKLFGHDEDKSSMAKLVALFQEEDETSFHSTPDQDKNCRIDN